MKDLFLSVFLIIISFNILAQPTGYGFGKNITIQSSQVSGSTDFVNFPMLVNETDINLRTVTNGGFVENANGYDITFYESDCITPLNYQIEKYDATTGEFVAWVQIPLLSTSTNQSIHMYYGNSSIVTDPSTNTIWDANYLSVYHFNDNVDDQSTAGNNGTDNGSTHSIGTQIGDGRSFDSDHIQTPISLQSENQFTLSAWFNTASINKQMIIWQGHNTQNGWGSGGGVNEQEMHLTLGTCCSNNTPEPDDVIDAYLGNDEDESDGEVLNRNGTHLGIGIWQYATAVFSNLSTTPQVDVYLNGAHIGTDLGVADPTTARNAWNRNLRIGRAGAGTRTIDGMLDEIRISNTVRSADLIATEYNNQFSPSTFYSAGAHMTAFFLCNVLSTDLSSFTTNTIDNKRVNLNWETKLETNNNYFSLEKSKDGKKWETFAIIESVENSSSSIKYNEIDNNPFLGTSYYRIKQTDYNGKFSYSSINNVKINTFNSQIKIYPNPILDQITIEGSKSELSQLKLYNILGQDITVLVKKIDVNERNIIIDLSDFENGTYYVKTKTNINKIYKK